jgi:hypothetical protein
MVCLALCGGACAMNTEGVNDREGLDLEVCHRGLLWFDDAFFVYVLKNADRLAPVVSAVPQLSDRT